jgi:hypothetical protein
MLNRFCDDLYIRKTRYRMLTRSYDFKKADVIEEHRILKDTVLSRAEDEAVDAIQLHIGITADIIQKLQLPTKGRMSGLAADNGRISEKASAKPSLRHKPKVKSAR